VVRFYLKETKKITLGLINLVEFPFVLNYLERVPWSPIHFVADVTNHCNLRCIMCYPQHDNYRQSVSVDWTLDQFKRYIDTFHPRSVAFGATGEPLLNPEINDMLYYSKKHGCKNIISTNGVMLEKSLAVLENITTLKLSFDAATDDTYRKIRNNPNFYTILNNIKRARELGVDVRFEYVIISLNHHEISEILKLAKSLNVQHVFYRIFQDEKLPKDLADMLRNIPTLNDDLEKASLVAKELEISTNLSELVQKKTYLNLTYNAQPIVDDRRKHVCLLPWTQLFANSDGDCGFCCNLSWLTHLYTGNLFKGDDVWNGSKMREYRRMFANRENYDNFVECSECEPMNFSNLLKWSRLMPSWWKIV